MKINLTKKQLLDLYFRTFVKESFKARKTQLLNIHDMLRAQFHQHFTRTFFIQKCFG